MRCSPSAFSSVFSSTGGPSGKAVEAGPLTLAARVKDMWAESNNLGDLADQALRVREQLLEAWAESTAMDDLTERAQRARQQAEEFLAELSLAHLPTVPELREKAEEMFQESPSLDEIVSRAHELLQRAVAQRVCDLALAGA